MARGISNLMSPSTQRHQNELISGTRTVIWLSPVSRERDEKVTHGSLGYKQTQEPVCGQVNSGAAEFRIGLRQALPPRPLRVSAQTIASF